MNTSVFDAETFLTTEVEGSFETKLTPVPEGDYVAYIDMVEGKAYETKDGLKPVIELHYLIDSEELKTELGLERPIVVQTIWVDLDESGSLSQGINQNVNLGAVREAVGQNPEQGAWAPIYLQGQGPVNVKVGHRFNQKTGEGPYAFIKRVAKYS